MGNNGPGQELECHVLTWVMIMRRYFSNLKPASSFHISSYSKPELIIIHKLNWLNWKWTMVSKKCNFNNKEKHFISCYFISVRDIQSKSDYESSNCISASAYHEWNQNSGFYELNWSKGGVVGFGISFHLVSDGSRDFCLDPDPVQDSFTY